MDLDSLVDTPRKQAMLGISVAFMIIFPAYFAVMPMLIDDDLMASSSGGGPSGEWVVRFEETSITLQESVNLGDGDSHDTFFDLESDLIIGYVQVVVACNDNDDLTPGFSDAVDVASDVSGVNSGNFSDQSDSGLCQGDAVTLRWDVIPGYNGTEYTASDMSENEIRAQWDDMGFARGTWAATITADVSSSPGIGPLNDNDEDYDITWTAMTFTLSLEPVVEL